MQVEVDKVQHFFACAAIALFADAAITLLLSHGDCNFDSSVNWVVLVQAKRQSLALALSMAVGVMKEVGDALDAWPGLCPCNPSVDDLLFDMYGVGFAWLLLCCRSACIKTRTRNLAIELTHESEPSEHV